MDITRTKEKAKKGSRWLYIAGRFAYRGFCYLKGIGKMQRDLSEYRKLNKRGNFSYQKKYKWFIDDSGG